MLAPVIIVGCGGSGVLSTRFIRDEVRKRLRANGIEKMPKAWQFIGLDLLPSMTDLHLASPLPADDYVSLSSGLTYMHELEKVLKSKYPVGNPALGHEELIGWRPVPQDVPGRIDIGAGMLRGVGRAAGTFALNQSQIKNRFAQALTAVQSGGAELATVSERLGYVTPAGGAISPPIVIVIGSCAGGTGAGVMLDVVDVIKRTEGIPVDPLVVAYGPDIFGSAQKPEMAANSLMFMSELMNAYYSSNGGKQGLFPAPVSEVVSRGPVGVMLVGRKNLNGLDLQDSKLVYRAVGIAMAGWVTSPGVRKEVQDHMLATWKVWAGKGGIGFADAEIMGVASSFGSASVSIGRSRFRDYARAYLMRDMYEHHSIGYFKLAEALLGIGKGKGPDDKVKLDLVEYFKPEYVRELGLRQSFNADFGIKEGPDAQVSEDLLSRQNVLEFANVMKVKLLAGLPDSSVRGQDWRRLLDDVERKLVNDEQRMRQGEFAARQTAWCQSMAERAVSVTNEYLARATLPVMVKMMPVLIQHIQSVAADFKSAAVEAKSYAVKLREERETALLSLGNANLTKESPGVIDAVTKTSQAFGQDLKHEISLRIAMTLEQVATNLFGPIRSAMLTAEGAVGEMTVKQLDQEPVISAWPYADVVPTAFAPSAVEFLLEDHTEWPGILRNLLSNVERRPGESAIDAVRRHVSLAPSLFNGELAEGTSAPLLWIREGQKLEFSATMPVPMRVGLAQSDLEDRIDSWMMREGELSRHLSEGLKTYLQDEANTNRFLRFKEKFTLALNQALPLVEVDEVYTQVVDPSYQLEKMSVMEPLPFPDGHPARESAEALVRTQLAIPAQSPVTGYFGDRDVEGVVVTSFLKNPLFPGALKSFTSPIATAGSSAKNDLVGLRRWLKFKRSRTLDETIPLPERVTGAMVRGFAVARVLGTMTLDKGSGARIANGQGEFVFPNPSFAPFTPGNTLVSLLMSFPLTFIDLPSKGVQAFAAYKALFGYGVPSEDKMAASQFDVVGDLQRFLDTGQTQVQPLDQQRRNEFVGAQTLDDRKRVALEILKSNTDYFEKILKDELTGNETVDKSGIVEPESVVVREIGSILLAQYEVVATAIRNYAGGGISTGVGPNA
jgi:hypothetical protein